MGNSSTERQELRNTLLSNGYHPLPAGSKGVYIKGWSRVDLTPEWLDDFRRRGNWSNTGLRCDDLLAFDIDVTDISLSDMCEELIERELGATEFCRVGRWPKRLLLYRLDGEPTLSARIQAAAITNGSAITRSIFLSRICRQRPATTQPASWICSMNY